MINKNVTKLWIIVLTILLVAALALCVVIQLRLNRIQDDYYILLANIDAQETEPDAADVQRIAELEAALADAQADLDSAAQRESDLQAQVDALQAEADSAEADSAEALTADVARLQADLDAANARADSAEQQLAEAQAELNRTQTVLDDLQAELANAHAQLDYMRAEIVGMREQLAAAESQPTAEPAVDVAAIQDELDAAIAERDAAADEASELQAQLDEANAGLANAQNELNNVNVQLVVAQRKLDEANAQLAAAQAELAMYRVGETDAGQSHASANVADSIRVDADGVTAHYVMTNYAASGNSVIYELYIDGEVLLYSSDIIAPGESLSELTLNRQLESGTYDGTVKVTTVNADGEASSVITAPVKIEVAE